MKQSRWLAALVVGAFLLNGIAFGSVSTGGAEAECREVGNFDYAYKIDNWDSGDMTGDYTDPVTGVTFTIKDYKPASDTFDWSATAAMDAVIVKAGNDSEVYTYVPPAVFDTGLVAPDDKEVSHVTFCWNAYAPLEVSKTADASYDLRVEWTLDKNVDVLSHTGFVGGPAGASTWEVSVTRTEFLENYVVEGEITITNPNDIDVDFALTDVLDDGTSAAVTCPVTADNTGTVPANSFIVCDYTATADDDGADKNVVTVTSLTDGVDGDTAEAFFTWESNLVGSSSATLTDDRFVILDNVLQTEKIVTYTEPFTCSSNVADYVDDGTYTVNEINTAVLTLEDGATHQAQASVVVTCYAPLVSKTAVASYDERHDWDVSKSVVPVSQSGFAGETLSWEWVIDVTETIENGNFAIGGVITVVNPSPDDPMTVSISDTLDDGTLVTLDCGGSLLVPAGGSETCGYSAVPLDASATLNTAVATLNDIGFPATAPVIFTKNVVNDSATVTDEEVGLIDRAVSGGDQFKFVDTHVCSSDIADYGADGSYTELVTNNVTLRDSGGNVAFDYATTTYTCYAPLVSKDAFTKYTRTHDWSIDKSVDTGFTHNDLPKVWLYIDGEGTATWTVDVTYEGYTDSDFVVFGTITVVNPNPDADMTVTLSDSVGGIPATLDCGGTLTVAAGQTGTCGYSATLGIKADGTNTATVTLNEIDFTATAGYVFGDPTDVVDETVNVKDISDLLGEQDFGPVTAPNNAQFTYSKTFEWEDYGADGCGDFVYDNTATIVETGASASATLLVNVQCFVYETAYAKGDDAKCFIPDFARWGWTNPITPGNYEMDLWAAAAQCDTGKGTLVGTVTVVYDADGYVTVTYNVGAPYMLDETHVYAGVDMYPKRGRRSTVAPGSYTNASPFDGDQVYVIAHAVVGLPDPDFGP